VCALGATSFPGNNWLLINNDPGLESRAV